MLFTQVNPEKFLNYTAKTPRFGRGAWTTRGMANGSKRYELLQDEPKIGTNAQVSLDAWATCAGSYGFQKVLISRGFLRELDASELGIFGPATRLAVMAFQRHNTDPESGNLLVIDGIIGLSDARSLLTPLIDTAEMKYDIPDHLLRGETNHESLLDVGALGYYIWYGTTLTYRGVDRSASQINSNANKTVTWTQAFDPVFALDWSAKRMRSYYNKYLALYPTQNKSVLWDAALCAHNNPSAAATWARTGAPPTTAAAGYVKRTKAAIY